jgi:hypothetical protein
LAAGLLGLAGLVPGGTKAASDHASLRAAALQAFRSELANRAAPNEATHGTVPAASSSFLQRNSYNWAGFVDQNATVGKFTSVSGSWVVPAITCTSEDRIMSVWVGLDGAGPSDPTVEQDGIAAQCFGGTAHYYSWYEMYPAASAAVGMTVQPGDHIAASVSRSGTTYTLKLTDSTTSGNGFTRLATCAAATCKDQSVEWIVERPAFRTTGIVPLAPFGTVTISSAPRNITGFGPSTVTTQITMVDSTGSYRLDTTSLLNIAHNGFSTTWLNSY